MLSVSLTSVFTEDVNAWSNGGGGYPGYPNLNNYDWSKYGTHQWAVDSAVRLLFEDGKFQKKVRWLFDGDLGVDFTGFIKAGKGETTYRRGDKKNPVCYVPAWYATGNSASLNEPLNNINWHSTAYMNELYDYSTPSDLLNKWKHARRYGSLIVGSEKPDQYQGKQKKTITMLMLNEKKGKGTTGSGLPTGFPCYLIDDSYHDKRVYDVNLDERLPKSFKKSLKYFQGQKHVIFFEDLYGNVIVKGDSTKNRKEVVYDGIDHKFLNVGSGSIFDTVNELTGIIEMFLKVTRKAYNFDRTLVRDANGKVKEFYTPSLENAAYYIGMLMHFIMDSVCPAHTLYANWRTNVKTRIDTGHGYWGNSYHSKFEAAILSQLKGFFDSTNGHPNWNEVKVNEPWAELNQNIPLGALDPKLCLVKGAQYAYRGTFEGYEQISYTCITSEDDRIGAYANHRAPGGKETRATWEQTLDNVRRCLRVGVRLCQNALIYIMEKKADTFEKYDYKTPWTWDNPYWKIPGSWDDVKTRYSQHSESEMCANLIDEFLKDEPTTNTADDYLKAWGDGARDNPNPASSDSEEYTVTQGEIQSVGMLSFFTLSAYIQLGYDRETLKEMMKERTETAEAIIDGLV